MAEETVRMSSGGWTTKSELERYKAQLKAQSQSKRQKPSKQGPNVDSKESLERFVAAAHSPAKKKNVIVPVPGKPPHLWHLFQNGKEDPGAPDSSAKVKGPASQEVKPGHQNEPQPTNGEASQVSSTRRDRRQIDWSKTRNEPKNTAPWIQQLGVESVVRGTLEQSASLTAPDNTPYGNNSTNNQQSDTGAPNNLQTLINPRPFVPKPRATPDPTNGWDNQGGNWGNQKGDWDNQEDDWDDQKGEGRHRPALYQSFVSASSPKHPALTNNEASAMPLTEARLAAQGEEFAETDRKPRRYLHFSDPSQASFDSLSTIRSKSYGATAPVTKDSEARTRSDIRNTLAPKHNINDFGNKWVKVNWGATGPDEDISILTDPSFISKFVFAWMEDIPDNFRVDLSVGGHHNSDIDTDTGRFLMPLECPSTMIDPEDLINERIRRARLHDTADLLIEAKRRQIASTDRSEYGGGYRRNRKARPRTTQQKYSDPTPNYPDPAPSHAKMQKSPYARLGLTNQVDPSLTEKLVAGSKGKFALEPRSEFSPRVPCYLRPAEKKDMDAVANIYNTEAMKGMQALDTAPVSPDQFENILSTVIKLGMPFIVAVRGSAKDFKAANGNFEFSPFTQLAPYVADPLDAKQNGTILGFAYLSVWEPGISADGNGSSRASARVNVFVDPKYRRKKIGFCLMDKLISSVSRRYSPESSYDFIDLHNSPVYKYSLANSRKYFRLYVSYFVKHAHKPVAGLMVPEEQKNYDNDLAWVRKLLDGKFNFAEKVRFETTHRSRKGVEGRPVYWLDSVVFEHTCHLDARAIPGDY